MRSHLCLFFDVSEMGKTGLFIEIRWPRITHVALGFLGGYLGCRKGLACTQEAVPGRTHHANG